jgi:hypothetical protein
MNAVEDKTDFISRPESKVGGVSVRGWLALVIIFTACACALAVVLAAVSVSIYTGSLAALSNGAVSTMFSGVKELALIALGYYCGKGTSEHITRPVRKPAADPPETAQERGL